MSAERNRLRATFDRVASLYDEARPGYPEALFDDVVSLSGVPPEGRVLEVGCGTGQATVPLARRGYRVLCVELGENLAAVARRRLVAYPQVEVSTGAFEDWPAEEGAFDLVASATAFHWIDPEVAYPKAAQALRSGGAIALFWNEHVQCDESEGFFEAAQAVYRREAPEIFVDNEDYKGPPHPDEVPDRTGEIEESGVFGGVKVRKYLWEATYDAGSYLRVLNTYSSHRNLNSTARERLFLGIAELIDAEFGGSITKGYLSVLYVAHARAGSP